MTRRPSCARPPANRTLGTVLDAERTDQVVHIGLLQSRPDVRIDHQEERTAAGDVFRYRADLTGVYFAEKMDEQQVASLQAFESIYSFT